MTTSIKLNKTAINTSKSLQFVEQKFAKSAAQLKKQLPLSLGQTS